MPKDLDLDIKEILGELNDVNSKNEQKVVAIASWNERPETVDIRRYNVVDEILTKGISLTLEETEKLIYILLSNPRYIKYDPERVRQILNEQEQAEVNVETLVEQLNSEENSDEEISEQPVEAVSYGNMRRIVLKDNGIFSYSRRRNK